ncbi:hypothetical protein [Burkholderia vietnamiensis]|uniref:hypothetical protein n=1 Tax=Burkholderia vietnamiensis TaxID=60552 RepID=UPI001F349CDB|nr:hypothetical protein [Burkholderia vietnamiensis]
MTDWARSASRPLTLGTRDRIRVETVETIVGELTAHRGNKVFQVVTPVGQGFPGFFAVFGVLKKVIFTYLFRRVFIACA